MDWEILIRPMFLCRAEKKTFRTLYTTEARSKVIVAFGLFFRHSSHQDCYVGTTSLKSGPNDFGMGREKVKKKTRPFQGFYKAQCVYKNIFSINISAVILYFFF